MLRGTTLVLLYVSVVVFPLQGQSIYTPVTNHFTVNEGLSQNTVHDITQDDEGFIWISTRAGLNRFDGYNFISFLNDPDDPYSISSSFVWVTLEDRDQNLWVGTSGGGLNLLDRDTGNFHEFKTDPDDPGSISFNTITALFEDSSGNLWIGTEGGGLNRLDQLNRTVEGYSASFERYLGENQDGTTGGDVVMGIAEDEEGTIWIATYGDGIYRLNSDTGTFEPALEWIDPYSMSISVAGGNQLWIGTKYGGVVGYDIYAGNRTIFNSTASGNYQLDTDFAWPVVESADGILWLGMYGGGLKKAEPGQEDGVVSKLKSITRIEDPFILSVFEDEGGVIWVGTEDQGIYTVVPQPEFKLPEITFEDGYRLDETKVTSMEADAYGHTWMGTNRGLYRKNQSDGLFSMSEEMPTSIQVRGTYLDYDETLWFKTNQGLFYSRDGSSINQKHTDSGFSVSDRIFSMLETTPGNFWISGNSGVLRWNLNGDEWEHFYHDSADDNSLSSNTASTLFYRDNYLWIGTSNAGLNRIDLDTGNVERFTTGTHRSNGLVSNRISGIVAGDDDVLWIGTSDAGLFTFDIVEEEFVPVPLGSRSSSRIIYNMFRPEDDVLLLATQAGLFSINTNDFEANFMYVHGMDVSQVAERFFAGQNGELYVAKDFGLLEISSLDHLKTRNNNSPVTLTDVTVGGETLKYGSLFSSSDPIMLNHDDRGIAIEFSLLDYSSPSENQFEYKLDGVYDDWVSLGTQNYISYASLDPQTYRLAVRGISPEGVISNNLLRVLVEVAPPFWQTVWFRLFVLIGLLGVIYSGYRYRLHYMLREERARLQIARDLHDEISSTLSSISFFSEAIDKSKVADTRSRHFLDLIKNSSFEAKEKISDIIWVTHPEHDSWDTFIIKCKRQASDLLDSRQIQQEFLVSGDFPKNISLPLKKNAWLIYREILTNIVKHSNATRVEIGIYSSRKKITFEISDDGNGFKPADQKEGGYGIGNIKSRVIELNGEWGLHTSEEGTEWKVTFPI